MPRLFPGWEGGGGGEEEEGRAEEEGGMGEGDASDGGMFCCASSLVEGSSSEWRSMQNVCSICSVHYDSSK